MVSLKTLKCPRCGATVQLDATGERATCPYCNTVSYTDRVGHPGAPIIVVKSHPAVLLSLGLGFVAVLVAGAAVLGVRSSGPSEQPAPKAPSLPLQSEMASTPPPPAAPAPKARAPEWSIESYTAAALVDSDGDGKEEVLVPVTRVDESGRTARFAIYAPAELRLLRESAALTDPQRALRAVVAGRMILARPNGELEAYALASGERQWNTVLGERVAALCAADAKHADALHVATDDGRNLLVDVTTGRQSETRSSCPYPLAVEMGRDSPADRRDYRAPRGVPAYRCGGVRVMGSQNYVVADACRKHFGIDTDRLDGMVGHAVWGVGKAALVFGVRKPGAYIPMVALREGARFRWKSEVPLENPLAAEQGGPRVISLRGDSLVIAYADAQNEQQFVTRFDVRDGTRTWNVRLPSSRERVIAALESDGAVVVHTARSLFSLSPERGELLATAPARASE